MRIFGLTGGIASGKSTVAKMFRELGAKVVDADALAREVVEPGQPALADIAKAFGDDVLLADGSLDRKKLGAIVFANPEARATLNGITHPRIAQLGQQRLAEHAAAGARVALYEAALIVENNLQRAMNGLIVVSVPEPVQLQRLQDREGLSREDAEARLASQLPLAKKLEVADHVIDNSGTPDETRTQVQALWAELTQA